jgi:hypothetical protein
MSRDLSCPPRRASSFHKVGSVFLFGHKVTLLNGKDAEADLTVKLPDGLDITNEE